MERFLKRFNQVATTLTYSLISMALLSSQGIAATLKTKNSPISHLQLNPLEHTLPLDLSTEEYRLLWLHRQQLLTEEFGQVGGNKIAKEMEDNLEPETREAIAAGEKLSLWLKTINQSRSDGQQIRLTNPGTRRGIPIDSPNVYGPKQIKESLAKVKSEINEAIKDVVFGKLPVGTGVPTNDETFIVDARKVDRLYQTAVRWTTAVKPWLSYYKTAKARDVRGYYHLKKISDLDVKLKNFANLPAEEQKSLKDHLLGLCQNSRRSLDDCSRSINTATTQTSSNALIEFKNRHWKTAESVWKSFFDITSPRTDIEWSGSNPNLAVAPFKDPNNNRIRDFLKENIEDEFKFGDWRFLMDFIPGGSGTAYLEFQPNVTPHVSGGNVIVMDANAPIEEYEVQWTIRHEYGHILRMPDCYVEFYDEGIESVVNYQIDTTDLMCSRAGDMNERIYLELKKAYFRK